jgi:DNA replication protein DnaC
LSTPCKVCASIGYVVGRREELAWAEVCQECSAQAADESRWYRIERDEAGYEVAVPTGDLHLVRRVRCFNEARLPAAYGAKTMAGFKEQKAHRGLKTRLLRYTQRFDLAESDGVLLLGPPGTDFFDLTVQIRGTYDPSSQFTEASLIDPLVAVPVLAIDELGKGRSTHYERTIVDQLISRRYNAGRIVLASSNYFPEEDLAASLGPGGERTALSLEERVGPRIKSRLFEMCEVYSVGGDDYRLRKRTQRA